MTRKWVTAAAAARAFAESHAGGRCPACGYYYLPGRLCPTDDCDMLTAEEREERKQRANMIELDKVVNGAS